MPLLRVLQDLPLVSQQPQYLPIIRFPCTSVVQCLEGCGSAFIGLEQRVIRSCRIAWSNPGGFEPSPASFLRSVLSQVDPHMGCAAH